MILFYTVMFDPAIDTSCVIDSCYLASQYAAFSVFAIN